MKDYINNMRYKMTKKKWLDDLVIIVNSDGVLGKLEVSDAQLEKIIDILTENGTVVRAVQVADLLMGTVILPDEGSGEIQ